MSETTNTMSAAQDEPKRHSGLVQFFIRLVKTKPLGTIGAVIVLILLITAVVAEWLAPFPYTEMHFADKLEPPGGAYLLGTDHLGRDVLSRILYGARLSLYVGLGASALNVIVGVLIGMPSGYLLGKYDLILQRFCDAVMAFPGMIILITIMSLLGPGVVQLIVVLGILGGIGSQRLFRAAAISIRENAYFDAARAIGSSTRHMLSRHVLPNVFPIMIVAFSMSVAGNILAEASLSFLGFGIPPPAPSWGAMLSSEGRQYMAQGPWLAIWPGVALSITVYGISMFGDAIRDLVDPRLRGGAGRFSMAKKKLARRKGKAEAQEA